jgi:hypothetical protein
MAKQQLRGELGLFRRFFRWLTSKSIRQVYNAASGCVDGSSGLSGTRRVFSDAGIDSEQRFPDERRQRLFQRLLSVFYHSCDKIRLQRACQGTLPLQYRAFYRRLVY